MVRLPKPIGSFAVTPGALAGARLSALNAAVKASGFEPSSRANLAKNTRQSTRVLSNVTCADRWRVRQEQMHRRSSACAGLILGVSC